MQRNGDSIKEEELAWSKAQRLGSHGSDLFVVYKKEHMLRNFRLEKFQVNKHIEKTRIIYIYIYICIFF